MSGGGQNLRTFDSTVHAGLSAHVKARGARFRAVHYSRVGVGPPFIEQLDMEGSQSDRRLRPFAFLPTQRRKISGRRRVFTVPARLGANTRSVDARGAIFMALLIKLGYSS